MLSLQACVSVFCLLALVAAAPMPKVSDGPENVKEVENQEEELQSLLQLADEKSARPDVTVHEEHMQHMHEINGHKIEVDTARKTVSDTKTGEVLSDVKQEVNKADESADQPEVEVKTEVDVPEEGVHETIVQSGLEEELPTQEEEAKQEEEEEKEEIEFSPDAVAEYLYRTGDFDRFYAALAQLVNASVMTEEEAQSYSELVALEFDRMQMEEYENSILVQRRAPSMLEQYPVPMEAPNAYPLPLDSAPRGFPVPMDTPDMLYGLEQEPSAKDLDLEFDPYELLYALWNEAYGTGDSRAQALVTELFDKVRGDNDPDDDAQVRDILLDLIANSVMNEEPQPQQPMYGWQPILDRDTAPIQPMVNPVPVQPIEAEDEEAANELMEQTDKRAAEEPITEAEQPSKEENVKAPQPMEKSETKEESQESESSDSADDKPETAPVSAQKRAAETV